MSRTPLTPEQLRRRSRRRWLIRIATGTVAASTLGYAYFIEPHWVEVVRHDLPIDGLPDALANESLVQVSDLHFGPQVSDDYLHRTLTSLGRLDPGIVALTGDYVTCSEGVPIDQLRRGLDFLARGRLATVAVLGNHDYGRGASSPGIADQVARALESAGVTVLRNTQLDVAGLQLLGFGDLWGGEFHPWLLVPNLPPTTPRLALCHNPDSVDSPYWPSYRGWILSGHTHGGQCRVPGFRPPFLPTHNRLYVAGEYDTGKGRRLYINRGLGHLLRTRFCVRPEITVHRLLAG